jgi:hypothetical protein
VLDYVDPTGRQRPTSLSSFDGLNQWKVVTLDIDSYHVTVSEEEWIVVGVPEQDRPEGGPDWAEMAPLASIDPFTGETALLADLPEGALFDFYFPLEGRSARADIGPSSWAGRNAVRISSDPLADKLAPAWPPDGVWIVFEYVLRYRVVAPNLVARFRIYGLGESSRNREEPEENSGFRRGSDLKIEARRYHWPRDARGAAPSQGCAACDRDHT